MKKKKRTQQHKFYAKKNIKEKYDELPKEIRVNIINKETQESWETATIREHHKWKRT